MSAADYRHRAGGLTAAVDRIAALAGRRPWWALLLGVGALTAWRVAMLAANATDLHVTEAQYWFWSTELALGYHAKPPMVAWAIRLATELGGEADPFWVRLPAPLLQALTALLVGLLAARLWDSPAAGATAGLAYATLPLTSLESQLITTDAVMLPFAAGAALLWMRLVARPSTGAAVALGLCVGLGLLAKYAMVYIVIGAALLALVRSDWRPPRRAVGIAAGVALAAFSVNLGWNLWHGGVTLTAVLQAAGPAEGFPRFDSLADFLAAQFAVMGPILLLAWLTALARLRDDRATALLRWLSLPAFLIVCAQALRAQSEPNWAAAMLVTATPLAAMALRAHAPRLLALSFALHLAVALALPLGALAPQALRWPGGAPLYADVTGQAALAREIAAMAERAGARVILSDDPALLGALVHTLRDAPLAIRAPAPQGRPDHQFQMALPLEREPAGPVLKVSTRRAPDPPPGFARAEVARQWIPDAPFMRGRPLFAYRFSFE
jgi:4-amino-4-deoxy-L-arabinose transferase-like glycosyltransferase